MLHSQHTVVMDRRYAGKVDRAGLQFEHPHISLRDDLPHNAVQIGHLAVVVLIAIDDDMDIADPLAEDERPGPHWLVIKRSDVDILPFEQVFRDDPHGERIERRGERFAECDLESMGIDNLPFCYLLIITAPDRDRMRVHKRLKGEEDIFSRKWNSIVPIDIIA